MPVDAFIHLDRLRCIEQHDTNDHSEPYIWPLYLWVDNTTIGSDRPVRATAHGNAFARDVIKAGIDDGDVVPIPASVRTLAHRFDDDAGIRQFGIVVLLLEEDETPGDAVRAGYSAFVRELPKALSDFVRQNLRAPESDAEIQEIVDEVRPKIRDAVSDELSAYEKAQIFLGTLDLDDEQGFDRFWVDLGADDLPDEQFTLRFVNTRVIRLPFGNQTFEVTTNYEIDGRYELREPPAPDRCQDEIDRLRDARAAVDGLEAMIQSLQAELRNASPSQKAGLIAEIRRIRAEELPSAAAAVERAERLLAQCRRRQVVTGEVIDVGGVQEILRP